MDFSVFAMYVAVYNKIAGNSNFEKILSLVFRRLC